MKSSWIGAFGLLLLFEGIIPFLFPKHWREAFSRILQFTDGQIRFVGLIVLLCGLGIISLT